jgi:hypothetical protein
MLKLRAGLLGLLAMLLLGAFAAAPAFAEGGPFCHHREVGEKTEGKRITEAEPEEIAGHGGVQTLTGLGLTIESEQAQVKGIIYNNADQCQSKVAITYSTPKIVGNPNCEVKINSNNVVKLFGHQAWKWNGTKEQLEEKSQAKQHRDWIFLPVELQQGAKELPTGTPFASITISSKSGVTCNPLFVMKQAKVEGSATIAGFALQRGKENQNLEEWDEAQELRATGGEGKQHFWNGSQFIGVQTGLTFGAQTSLYNGAFEINTIGKQEKTPAQEMAYFEK